MTRRSAFGPHFGLLLLTLAGGSLAGGCSEKPKADALPAPKVASDSPGTAQPSAASSQPSAAAAPAAATGISKYRKGDKVVYAYTGSFSAVPVKLTEEVLSVTAGNVLEIKVTAERGAAKRSWIQVVTDTPENQRNNLVDALFELDEHGQRKQLKDIRSELFRLYEWTLPSPMDTPPENSTRSKEKVDILGTEYLCEVERGENKVAGKKVTFAFRQCPGFLWTKGPSELLTESGAPVWKVDVLSSTRAQ